VVKAQSSRVGRTLLSDKFKSGNPACKRVLFDSPLATHSEYTRNPKRRFAVEPRRVQAWIEDERF